MQYQNPIIPGFYPDPSICRVGEDYYLVNSSFEFYPGVPLWHSKDLVHWTQLGNILTRESQLPLKDSRTSCGIYAPTLRYHEGRFYMVTTNVSHGGNFYVWTDDIEGEWSDPIYVKQRGIDPSLFWDEDGTVYFTSTSRNALGAECIGQCTIDIATGEMLTPTREIWAGTGGKYPEGPHLYHIGEYYYLMIAEGGTEYGHHETIARSESPWGPFKACPHNPILSHVNCEISSKYEFHGVGHADLVKDPKGQWWMVFHAIRPSQFMLHHIGRETMLAPVTWDENGWPVVNGGNPVLNPMSKEDMLASPQFSNWRDDFSEEKLHPRWTFLRNPKRGCYEWGKKGLILCGSDDLLDGMGSPTLLAVRQQQFAVEFDTEVEILNIEEDAAVGVTVFHTCQHHYDLMLKKKNGKIAASLRRRVADILAESEPVWMEEEKVFRLRILSDRYQYSFYAGTDEENMKLIGTGSTQLLSTECMICTFTGCFEGMFVEGKAEACFHYCSVARIEN